LASLSLIVTIVAFLVTAELYDNPATVNIGSLIVCLSSVLFFGSVLTTAGFGIDLSGRSFVFRLYYRIVSIALLTVSCWLLLNDLIGFRFWAY